MHLKIDLVLLEMYSEYVIIRLYVQQVYMPSAIWLTLAITWPQTVSAVREDHSVAAQVYGGVREHALLLVKSLVTDSENVLGNFE